MHPVGRVNENCILVALSNEEYEKVERFLKLDAAVEGAVSNVVNTIFKPKYSGKYAVTGQHYTRDVTLTEYADTLKDAIKTAEEMSVRCVGITIKPVNRGQT